ncbi:hypothetical protein COO60DRAFT_1642971 [Scenedesmus sp. NREL 46B-D3]|nr:hypothetical protein COO60DRAFT_1642971 [Scenedesmus sp. NREL 46B-D3]
MGDSIPQDWEDDILGPPEATSAGAASSNAAGRAALAGPSSSVQSPFNSTHSSMHKLFFYTTKAKNKKPSSTTTSSSSRQGDAAARGGKWYVVDTSVGWCVLEPKQRAAAAGSSKKVAAKPASQNKRSRSSSAEPGTGGSASTADAAAATAPGTLAASGSLPLVAPLTAAQLQQLLLTQDVRDAHQRNALHLAVTNRVGQGPYFGWSPLHRLAQSAAQAADAAQRDRFMQCIRATVERLVAVDLQEALQEVAGAAAGQLSAEQQQQAIHCAGHRD